jgi:hypothetical protein
MQKQRALRLPSLISLRPYFRLLARSTGYELVGEGEGWRHLLGYKIYPRNLPDVIQQESKDPYYHPLRVDIESITSRIGFSYREDGWHPFVQTLKEYAENPNLCYEESTLAKLYRQYCPANVQSVLLDHINIPVKPFCDWPPIYELISWVWTLSPSGVQKRLSKKISNSSSSGWILYGPHSEDYARKEFKRLIEVYESVKESGYQSDLSGMDPVNGYFLKDGNYTRFVLLQGNHRVSALKALGYKHVDVLIRQGHPAVVDRDDLHRWTETGGGIYSSFLTEQLFQSLLTQSGLQKAQRYGLAK